MREVVELNIADFKSDILGLASNPSMFNEVEKRLQNQVEVLEQWANIHEAFIEKLQDDKTFSFMNVLARSESTATIFTALLALNANVNNTAGHAQSVISFSGLGKLDKILNETKTKVLKCMSSLTDYIYDEMTTEEAEMAPMSTKLLVLLPYLIESLTLFAKDPNMSSLL